MKEKSDIVYDTTVVIAEDELLVRIGIKSSVDWEKNGFKLLGEAADGNEAIQMVRKFLPHILLLDIKMPGMSGLDILKIIQLEKIPTKVIIISGLDDFMSVKSAMQSEKLLHSTFYIILIRLISLSETVHYLNSFYFNF